MERVLAPRTGRSQALEQGGAQSQVVDSGMGVEATVFAATTASFKAGEISFRSVQSRRRRLGSVRSSWMTSPAVRGGWNQTLRKPWTSA
jgi:hypothetical protein